MEYELGFADEYELGEEYELDDEEYYVGDATVEDLLEVGAPVVRDRRGSTRRAPTRSGRRRIVRAAPRGVRRAYNESLGRRMSASRPVVQARGPTRQENWPLGFDSGANIAAGASANVVATPQVLFKGKRLVVPASIAALFTIDTIVVGNANQTPAVGPNPAETFSQLGQGVQLSLRTAQVNQQITIGVTNISGGAARFRASLIGDAAF